MLLSITQHQEVHSLDGIFQGTTGRTAVTLVLSAQRLSAKPKDRTEVRIRIMPIPQFGNNNVASSILKLVTGKSLDTAEQSSW